MKQIAGIITILSVYFLTGCSTNSTEGGERETVITAPDNKENRVSPAEVINANINGNDITVNYGSPKVKGREIWGSLVPYDEVWRTGANEATTISFSKDVLIDGQLLQSDVYSFFTIPSSDKWTAIFNLEEKQWGAFKYDSNQDALRIQITPDTIALQEEMKFEVNPNSENGGVISLKWEKMQINVPFTNAPE